MGAAEAKAAILANKTALGIEFGSTRIKAVLVDDKNQPIASGGHEWENRYENGVWTYSLDDIWTGIQDCYQDMARDAGSFAAPELPPDFAILSISSRKMIPRSAFSTFPSAERRSFVKMVSTSSPTYPASVREVQSAIAKGTSSIFATV